MRVIHFICLAAAVLVLLASCGGGGRTTPTPQDNPGGTRYWTQEVACADGSTISLTLRIWRNDAKAKNYLQLDISTTHAEGAWAWVDYQLDDGHGNPLGSDRIAGTLDRNYESGPARIVREIEYRAYGLTVTEWQAGVWDSS